MFFLFQSNRQPRFADQAMAEVVGKRQRKPTQLFGEAGELSDDDDDWERRQRRRERDRARGVGAALGEKRRRCGECEGCNARECGKCRFCKDMPKFGGTGGMRQACERRKCTVMREEEEEEAVKRAAERAERREAEREVREAERERLREEKETARALGRDARGEGAGLGRRDKGGLGLKLGAKRRTPSVELEEGIGGGWGAHAAQIAAGDRVEVAMKEEGLASVAYLATLVEPPGADGDGDAGRQHRKLRGKGKGKAAAAAADAAAQVHVRYDELLPDGAEDDSAERLCEPVPAGDVRPQPPPTPCGFHALIAAGDIVELYYDDGWWEVKVEAVVPVPKAAPAEGAAPAGTADGGVSHHFRVVSTMYAKWHTVPADMLRPQWLWAPAARAWRYELDAGHGCVAAGLAAVATFRFAHGISRRHNKSAFSVD